MRKLFAALLATVTFAHVNGAELVDAIDPRIGSITDAGTPQDAPGKTFPGAATPFGLIQLSPDTITGGDNGPGYSAHHKTIEGFSFLHLSGIGWYGELGNFQVMPCVGDRQFDREAAKSPYSHADEKATAGYYRVGLQRYGIRAEMTAAPHAGILRFTFPASDTARIQIDLGRRIGQRERWLKHSSQTVNVVGNDTIEGVMRCPCADGGWGRGGGHVSYSLHYHAVFSKPFAAFGVWDKNTVLEGRRSYEGTNTGFYAEFKTKAGEQILLRAGLSFVSLEGARANLAADIPSFDFDGTATHARALWADALAGFGIEGGTEKQRTIFATALYHAFLDPRSVSDVNGDYIGADNQVHRAKGFVYRSVFSGWDVFRSEFPLLTLARPDVVNDEINSLLQMARLSGHGYFPRWELLNAYSGCMIGNPAVSVVVDAWTKGIRGYDAEEAYKACKASVEKFGNGDRGFTPGNLSMTLEYAYTDWCTGIFAKGLNHNEDAARYLARAAAYTNCWSAEAGWMRSRESATKWTPWQGRETMGQGCVESNPYQQGWFVPHDVAGFAALMGGKEPCIKELETFFSKTPGNFRWNNFYNHANEPVHHIPYLFDALGVPRLTQKWTRRICEGGYGLGPEGLCGNDDVGQMSAWYILSAAGLHMICPGDRTWWLTSPVFPKVFIRVGNGKFFTVISRNASPENIYIQSATLNGKPLNRFSLLHSEITAGGTLVLEMGR